jgi:hypothetical protein
MVVGAGRAEATHEGEARFCLSSASFHRECATSECDGKGVVPRSVPLTNILVRPEP